MGQRPENALRRRWNVRSDLPAGWPLADVFVSECRAMIRHIVPVLSALALVGVPVRLQAQKPSTQQKPAAPLARWIDLQNATLNLRYRFIDTSAGVVTTNSIQHRETLRARLKFDAPGKY